MSAISLRTPKRGRAPASIKPCFRVLQVEENPGDARVVRKLLGKAFQLERQALPQSALERLAHHDSDIVLVSSGNFDLGDWINKAQAVAPAVPVFVLARSGEMDTPALSGADGFLVKGQATGSELRRTLRQMIENRHRLRTEGEVSSAGGLQRSFLPSRVPEIDGLQIAASSWPLNTTSGDWYDFLPNMNLLSILVADVMGHDLAAALLMASARSYFRALNSSLPDPAELMSGVNKLLLDDLTSSRFVTTGLLSLDPANLAFRVCLAGHPPPLRLDRYGNLSVLRAPSNLPLGIAKDIEFHSSLTYHLAQGDLVLLYTDGIEDVTNRDGEPFGRERLVRIMTEHRDLNAPELIDTLHENLLEYSREGRIPDDLTALILKAT